MAEPVDPRLSFDKEPEAYEKARPHYPPAAFDWLFSYLRVERPVDSPEVLEIGPGTGQATESLLAHGAKVTAVEIGPNLAQFLRTKYAGEQSLSVVTGEFESIELELESFDLVFTATAFHWLDPAVRLQKTHDLLRPGGVLGVLSTVQIRSHLDRGFFQATQEIYRRWGRGDARFDPPEENDVVPPEIEEMEASGLYTSVSAASFKWDQRYSAHAYSQLLLSYSDIQAMDAEPRGGLIQELREFIESDFDGYVVRPLIISLVVGRRPPSS